jgi:hypothetical protein
MGVMLVTCLQDTNDISFIYPWPKFNTHIKFNTHEFLNLKLSQKKI